MRKTRISLLFLIILSFSAIPFGFLSATTAVNTSVALPNYDAMKVGPEFRDTSFPREFERSRTNENSLKSSPAETYPGKWWMSADFYSGYYFYDYFELMAESANTQIWVQSYLNWYWPDDPRPTPVVTQSDVEFLLNEFDTVIYPRDTDYFGTPDPHDGSNCDLSVIEDLVYYGLIDYDPNYYTDSNGRNVILISNIEDDNYYDYLYPSYVAGFYSPSFERFFDRNIISIDCYNFTLRLGEGEPGNPNNRPYVYDGTIAHEYQHLIHDDYYPQDATYMNEACSLYAEPLCLLDQPNYELDTGQIEWFLETPDNSLTKWGDQGDLNILADYGSSFLWSIYLEEHYGPGFLSQYVQGNLYGLPAEPEDRISALIPGRKGFLDAYHDWRIANLLDTKIGCSTKYYYKLVDLHDLKRSLKVEELNYYPADWVSGSDFGPTITHNSTKYPNGYDTGLTTMNPYSTDYIHFNFDAKGVNTILFDGQDFATLDLTPQEQWVNVGGDGDYQWWSGETTLTNSLIATQVSVPLTDPILELTTMWDIEAYWDFGFVQVSTDGTWDSEWTSLNDLEGYATMLHYSAAISEAVDNLPGLTGSSDGWVTLTFDLSAYAGQDIYIGFRYVTDGAIEEAGWYIDDALVTGDGETTDIIQNLTPVLPSFPEVDYMVTVVQKFEFRHRIHYTIHDMWLKDDLTEIGITMSLLNRFEDVILIVSPMFEKGTTDYSFFTYTWHSRCRGR